MRSPDSLSFFLSFFLSFLSIQRVEHLNVEFCTDRYNKERADGPDGDACRLPASLFHMGVRSAEAIARRAAKRGRTVDEQKQADRAADRQRAKRLELEKALRESDQSGDPPAPQQALSEVDAPEAVNTAPAAPVLAGPVAVGRPVWALDALHKPKSAILKKDAKRGWMCMGSPGAPCGYVNFGVRQTCRECGAVRLAPPPKPPKRVDAATATRAAPSAATPRGKHVKPPSDPSRAWAGSNAAGAADKNAELRRRYAADASSLSAEERERAEALLQRDERKRAAKQQRRAAHKHSRTWEHGDGGKGNGRPAGVGSGHQAGGRTTLESLAMGDCVLSAVRGPPPAAGKRRRAEDE